MQEAPSRSRCLEGNSIVSCNLEKDQAEHQTPFGTVQQFLYCVQGRMNGCIASVMEG